MFLAPWATHLAPQPIVPDKRTTARVDIPSCNGWRRLRLEPWGVDENRRVSVSCEAGRGAWTRIGVCQCPAKRARSQTAYRSKASESKRPSRSVRVARSQTAYQQQRACTPKRPSRLQAADEQIMVIGGSWRRRPRKRRAKARDEPRARSDTGTRPGTHPGPAVRHARTVLAPRPTARGHARARSSSLACARASVSQQQSSGQGPE